MPLNEPDEVAGHLDPIAVQMVAQLKDILTEFKGELRETRAEVRTTEMEVVRLKEHEERVSRLEARVDEWGAKMAAIETTRQQQLGAAKAVEWLAKNWQFLAIAGAALAYAKGVI